MENPELKQAAGIEAAFVAAAASARSFADIMSNQDSRAIVEALFVAFKNMDHVQARRHAADIHGWLNGVPNPDPNNPAFPEAHQARDRVRNFLTQTAFWTRGIPDETVVLLMRVGLLMYQRVFAVAPGLVRRIPLMLDMDAFNADPIALECSKYILTGDTTGTIFRRETGKPLVNPKDDIRAHVMGNLQLSTLMKTVLTSFQGAVRTKVYSTVGRLSEILASMPRAPPFNLVGMTGVPDQAEMKSMVGVAVDDINSATETKFKLVQASARFGDALACLVAKNHRISIWSSEAARLRAERTRYNERLSALRNVMVTIDAYRALFQTHVTHLEALVFAVEPVAKTTDAVVLVARRASEALSTFVDKTRGMQPTADRPGGVVSGLSVFWFQIVTAYDPGSGQITMGGVQGITDTAASAQAYNSLIYMAVLVVCVIGRDAEAMRVVSREQMHLQSRLEKLSARIPNQDNMNNQAETADVARTRAHLDTLLGEANHEAQVMQVPDPMAPGAPSAHTIGDILALSSLFPVSTSDSVDHLLAFALGEQNIVEMALVNRRFEELGSRAVADRDDFAVGSLETAADFLATLAPHSPDPSKSTVVSDAVLVKRVTEEVTQRLAPRIQADVKGAVGDQRDVLSKSIVATNEARRKYERGVEAMSGKQRVFLNSAFADQVPLDKLDENSLKAVHADFLDEIKRMHRVVVHLPENMRSLTREELKERIATFAGENAEADSAVEVAWASPLLAALETHEPNREQETPFMVIFLLEQTISRLQTRWNAWVASTDHKDDAVEARLTELLSLFEFNKSQQFNSDNDRNKYAALSRFIQSLPVTRADDFKTLDDRTASLLKDKMRLETENQRLRQQMEAMREKARDDLAKIDLQRQRDADAFNNRLSEAKLKAVGKSQVSDKSKDKDKHRVNDRSGGGGGRAVMPGQAYVLNTLDKNESAAARVLDLAMDPIGLRMPMGFMHPFETQFRAGYRRGFNPLFWYQLLRDFVRTVATTANLAADRCLKDAMPDASLAQYAAFYEPQGYNNRNDSFVKDFRPTEGDQLYLPGRTEGKEPMKNRLIIDGDISPFVRQKLTEKFRNVDEFMSMDKVRAVRARLDFLKAREQRGDQKMSDASGPGLPHAVVQMGISRELKPPETKFVLESVASQDQAEFKSWPFEVTNRARAIVIASGRIFKLSEIGSFVPGTNVLRDKTGEFIDSFNFPPQVAPGFDEVTVYFSIPVVLFLGPTHAPRVTLVEYQWGRSQGQISIESLSRVYAALRKAANETEATGALLLARPVSDWQELTVGACFVPSLKTATDFQALPTAGRRKQFVLGLVREPDSAMTKFLLRELNDAFPLAQAPPPPPREADGDAARHGAFIQQPDDEIKGDVVDADQRGDNDAVADSKNIDDFMASRYAWQDVDEMLIGSKPLNDATAEELEAYETEHLELRNHARELAGQEAKFIAEMRRLSRVHAGNMENVLGEYLESEPPLSGIKQALHHARQLFRVQKKESPLLLAEFLVSTCANDDFAALVVAYIRKNNTMANNVVATKQLVADTNQMLHLAQVSMTKLAYVPKLTPFADLAPEDDPVINGQPYSDYFYFAHERQDFAQADSFTRRF